MNRLKDAWNKALGGFDLRRGLKMNELEIVRDIETLKNRMNALEGQGNEIMIGLNKLLEELKKLNEITTHRSGVLQ